MTADKGKVRRQSLTLKTEVLYALSAGPQTEKQLEGWLRRKDSLPGALSALVSEEKIQSCTVKGEPGYRLPTRG